MWTASSHTHCTQTIEPDGHWINRYTVLNQINLTHFNRLSLLIIYQSKEGQTLPTLTTPPSFDHHSNNLWNNRHRASKRFINAARTIIVRNRCHERLKVLRGLTRTIKEGGEVPTGPLPESASCALIGTLDRLQLTLASLKPCVLPSLNVGSSGTTIFTDVCTI